MIPDRVLMEVLGSANPEAFLAKLGAILSHEESRGRVLVGRYWDDIESGELTPAQVIPTALAAVHPELSLLIRRRAPQGRLFLSGDQRPESSELGDRKNKFIDMANEYVVWLGANRPESLSEMRKAIEGRTALIQQAGPAMADLAGNAYPRYKHASWRKALSVFPDKCAAGRWLRLVVWYAMRRAAAPNEPNEKFGNNYDDAHYAFLSLYTRHIATTDKGMKEAVDAVSGGAVKIYTDLSAIDEDSRG